MVAALPARRFADGPTACLLGALTMRGLALAFSPPEKNLEEIAGIQEALREAQVTSGIPCAGTESALGRMSFRRSPSA